MKAPEHLYKIDKREDDDWYIIGRYVAYQMVTKNSWWLGEYPDYVAISETAADTIAEVEKLLQVYVERKALEQRLPFYYTVVPSPRHDQQHQG